MIYDQNGLPAILSFEDGAQSLLEDASADVRIVAKALRHMLRMNRLPHPDTLTRYAVLLEEAGEALEFAAECSERRPDPDGTRRLGERDVRHDAARAERQGGPAGD